MVKPLFHRAYPPSARSFVISRTPPAGRPGQRGPQATRAPLFPPRRPAAGVYERAAAPGSGTPAQRKKFQGSRAGTGDRP